MDAKGGRRGKEDDGEEAKRLWPHSLGSRHLVYEGKFLQEEHTRCTALE